VLKYLAPPDLRCSPAGETVSLGEFVSLPVLRG